MVKSADVCCLASHDPLAGLTAKISQLSCDVADHR